MLNKYASFKMLFVYGWILKNRENKYFIEFVQTKILDSIVS